MLRRKICGEVYRGSVNSWNQTLSAASSAVIWFVRSSEETFHFHDLFDAVMSADSGSLEVGHAVDLLQVLRMAAVDRPQERDSFELVASRLREGIISACAA